MYCPKCGTQNDDNASKCTNCGVLLRQAQDSQVQRQPSANIPNYLPHAIVCTILCCWPLGIPAIVYAARVNKKIAAGDIAGAEEASRKAKIWCLASLGGGVVAVILYILGSVG